MVRIYVPKSAEEEYAYQEGVKEGNYIRLKGMWGEPVYILREATDEESPTRIRRHNQMRIKRAKEQIEKIRRSKGFPALGS